LQETRICLEIDRACFYCSGLDIIKYPNKGFMDNKNSCFLAYWHDFTGTHINASISLEACFVSRLDIIYLLVLNIW